MFIGKSFKDHFHFDKLSKWKRFQGIKALAFSFANG